MPDKELYCTLSLSFFFSLYVVQSGLRYLLSTSNALQKSMKFVRVCVCNDGRGRILPSFSAKALSARSAIAIDFPQTALSAFLPPPPLPPFLCFFTAALIADIHSLLFCFNSVHFLLFFFCFSSLKVQFSRSARILFVFSKPLESAFIMHLTLSSTAVSPSPPPAPLLLSPFQFALARPSLFCTHSLSSALHSHSPTAAAAITICSLPSVCPSHSC